jgi:DNA-binding beta-propeller fold protein YncE
VKRWLLIFLAGAGLLLSIRAQEPTLPTGPNAVAAPGSGVLKRDTSLRLSRTIALPDVPGLFNQMAADPIGQLLFATAPIKKTVEVIDLKTGKSIRSLDGQSPASVALAPEFNEFFVTRRQALVAYDRNSFAVVTNLVLSNSLNEIQYDSRARRLYVACQTTDRSGIAMIDVPTLQVLGTIPLPAKPMGFAREEKGNRIFANLPTLKQIVVLDRESQTILHTWTLAETSANYPMALDEARHRLFVGCRKPPQLAVFDTESGKQVASLPISGDTDGLFYDTARKRLYLSGGEGFLDVITQSDADTYTRLDQVQTAPGARNSLFSPALDLLFVAIPQRDNPVSEIRIFQPVE